MANHRHVEIVKKGAEAIAEWRKKNVGFNLDLSGASLHMAVLHEANLNGVNLARADLHMAYLFGADLNDADLRGTNLTDATVNSATSLHRAHVRNCRIDRHTLESLKDYGGLTKGDRMLMDIVDGVATLRASFSGFWQWIHLAAVALFLFPYAWFIGKHWTLARFGVDESDSTISLFVALIRFIWNGGENWRAGWALNIIPFGIFAYSLLYNALRGVLLWKTKTLELKQEASGLPAIFSLTGWWGWMFTASKWGMIANLVFVAWHTYYFLGQRIPLEG